MASVAAAKLAHSRAPAPVLVLSLGPWILEFSHSRLSVLGSRFSVLVSCFLFLVSCFLFLGARKDKKRTELQGRAQGSGLSPALQWPRIPWQRNFARAFGAPASARRCASYALCASSHFGSSGVGLRELEEPRAGRAVRDRGAATEPRGSATEPRGAKTRGDRRRARRRAHRRRGRLPSPE